MPCVSNHTQNGFFVNILYIFNLVFTVNFIDLNNFLNKYQQKIDEKRNEKRSYFRLHFFFFFLVRRSKMSNFKSPCKIQHVYNKYIQIHQFYRSMSCAHLMNSYKFIAHLQATLMCYCKTKTKNRTKTISYVLL